MHGNIKVFLARIIILVIDEAVEGGVIEGSKLVETNQLAPDPTSYPLL